MNYAFEVRLSISPQHRNEPYLIDTYIYNFILRFPRSTIPAAIRVLIEHISCIFKIYFVYLFYLSSFKTFFVSLKLFDKHVCMHVKQNCKIAKENTTEPFTMILQNSAMKEFVALRIVPCNL